MAPPKLIAQDRVLLGLGQGMKSFSFSFHSPRCTLLASSQILLLPTNNFTLFMAMHLQLLFFLVKLHIFLLATQLATLLLVSLCMLQFPLTQLVQYHVTVCLTSFPRCCRAGSRASSVADVVTEVTVRALQEVLLLLIEI